MALAAASGAGRGTAERGWVRTRASATRQLPAPPLRRGSYFWKQHPRGLQWMLLVLAPALTVLESLVKLHLAASELFKHRKGGVIGYRRFQIFFFLSTVWSRKQRFGLAGSAPAAPSHQHAKSRPTGQSVIGKDTLGACSPCLLGPVPTAGARATSSAAHTPPSPSTPLRFSSRPQRCTSRHPRSAGRSLLLLLLLLSCSLAITPIIKKPLCVSREAGLGEGHKGSRSCVFANNPAEL